MIEKFHVFISNLYQIIHIYLFLCITTSSIRVCFFILYLIIQIIAFETTSQVFFFFGMKIVTKNLKNLSKISEKCHFLVKKRLKKVLKYQWKVHFLMFLKSSKILTKIPPKITHYP